MRPKDAAVNAKNANDYYCPQPAAPRPVAPAPESNEAASPISDPTKAAKPTAAAKPTNLPATGD